MIVKFMRRMFMIQIPIYECDGENRRGVVHRITQSGVKRVPITQTVSAADNLRAYRQKQANVLRPWGTAAYATAGEMIASIGRPVPVLLTVASQ